MSSILISFLKIKEFESFFKIKRKGNLSKIFTSIIERMEKNDTIFSEVDKFKKLKNKKDKNVKDLPINEILEFILETLHEELNENKKEENTDMVFNSYDEYIKHYNEYNKSFIQKLFFGFYEYNVTCKKCEKEITQFDKFTIKYYDLTEREINIIDLIKENNEKIIKTLKCQKCNKSYEYKIIKHDVNEYPDILIINFNKIEKCIIKDYNNNLEICNTNQKNIKNPKNNEKEEQELSNKSENYNYNYNYNLICFIAKVNEYNQEAQKYNVFYLKNTKWYIYKIDNEQHKIIDNIKRIKANPLIAFYQKDKNKLKDCYYNLTSILDDKKDILKQINEHIIEYDTFDNYYIINNNWYNKILKIFESEDNYKNDEYLINENNLIKINELNTIDYMDKYKVFKERNNIFEDKSFNVDEIQVKDSEIKYPKDFMLIKENIFNNFLDDLEVINKDSYKNYLYQIKLGENLVFIKVKNNTEEIKNDKKEITIFVCSFVENIFKVLVILNYNSEEIFKEELKNYISNKGGLEYYYLKRNLEKNNLNKQKIINEKNNEIGFLIKVEELIKQIQTTSTSQNSDNIKMSMFSNFNDNDNNIKCSTKENTTNIKPYNNNNNNNNYNNNNNKNNNNNNKNNNNNNNNNNNYNNNYRNNNNKNINLKKENQNTKKAINSSIISQNDNNNNLQDFSKLNEFMNKSLTKHAKII